MSTTPTTSEPSSPGRYTIVSGSAKDVLSFDGVTVVILNRGGKPFKSDLLSSLCELQIREVISVETSNQVFEMEALASKYTSLKFLMVSSEISIGERINIAVKEASGSYVLVFWNDMNLQIRSQADRIFRTASEGEFLCRVPLLMNSRKESVPTRFAPGFSKKRLEVYPLGAMKNRMPTLYPYDYCGLYNKQKFILSGGFDVQIKTPYWQKLDFGFRVFLWGDVIETGTNIKLSYSGDIPREDTTRDEYYRRFFLKNLTLKFNGDSCNLPFSRFLFFLLKSGSGIFQAFKDYKAIRNWVDENSLRFKTDPYNLTELWEME